MSTHLRLTEDWHSLFFNESAVAEYAKCFPSHSNVPIRLNRNEIPWDWPEVVKEHVLNSLRNEQWNRYGSSHGEELNEMIGNKFGLLENQVLVGPGSSYHLSLLISLFSRTSDIVVLRPSFPLYESMCRAYGISVREWRLGENFEFDIRLLPELKPGTVVIFASPNNPTGSILHHNILKQLLINYPDTLFVGDQAYEVFSDNNLSSLIGHHNNLVIVHSLSKAMGTAGPRCSYLLGSTALVRILRRAQPQFMPNAFSLACLKATIVDSDLKRFWSEVLEKVCLMRENMANEIRVFVPSGVSVLGSNGNFLLLRWKNSEAAADVYSQLIRRGILIANFSHHKFLEGCLRVTVGREYENQAFVAALKDICSKKFDH